MYSTYAAAGDGKEAKVGHFKVKLHRFNEQKMKEKKENQASKKGKKRPNKT